MPASEIIKEYLVSLGVQDNLSEGLGNALENADGEVLTKKETERRRAAATASSPSAR